ncbi:hypothetical protein [Nocardia grenadensis]
MTGLGELEEPFVGRVLGRRGVDWLKWSAGVTLGDGSAGATAAQLSRYRDELVDAYSGRYRKVGITRAVAEPPRNVGSEQEYLDYLHWFAAEVMSAV